MSRNPLLLIHETLAVILENTRIIFYEKEPNNCQILPLIIATFEKQFNYIIDNFGF